MAKTLETDATMFAEVTHRGLLDMQVCVPGGWSDDQIIEFAEREYPCGTARGWQIRRNGDKLLNGDPERVPCSKRHGHVHVMLDA